MAFRKPAARTACSILSLVAILQFSLFGPVVGSINADDDHDNTRRTATPIKHVIILIGENRTFDHIFATYKPKPGQEVQSKPDLWASTAIFITADEGGGYYDSGYVQPLDFFGDGTRIPLIVVSPYTKPSHISHGYADHVSLLKFIERNWYLDPVTYRSRDNFPNPVAAPINPYVPTNSPAISDLFDLFQFSRGGRGDHDSFPHEGRTDHDFGN